MLNSIKSNSAGIYFKLLKPINILSLLSLLVFAGFTMVRDTDKEILSKAEKVILDAEQVLKEDVTLDLQFVNIGDYVFVDDNYLRKISSDKYLQENYPSYNSGVDNGSSALLRIILNEEYNENIMHDYSALLSNVTNNNSELYAFFDKDSALITKELDLVDGSSVYLFRSRARINITPISNDFEYISPFAAKFRNGS